MKPRTMTSYSKEPLALMYSKILQFINNDCNILLEITRKVLRGTGFEILVNSVWTEVVDAVNKRLSLIFNPGNPNMFHKVILTKKKKFFLFVFITLKLLSSNI